MLVKAIGRFIRISPMKARQVADLLQGNDVEVALSKLTMINKRASYFIQKVLNSAINNAKQKGFSEDRLYISKIIIDKGPMWKRYRARAFGRAVMIRKRTSHIKIELDLKGD